MGTNSQKKDILTWLNQTDIPLSVISKKSKVSRATLYNWKTNATKIGNKGADKIISVFKDEIHITTKDINVEGNIKIKHGKEGDGLEAQYIIDLQKDKIESQANKIILLEKQLINKPIVLIGGNIPDWNTIEFDVKTIQSYKSTNCLFSEYQMDDYVKFFNYLGYNPSEARIVWEKHCKYMTSTKTYNKEDFIKNSPFVNINESGDLICNHSSTMDFIETNIKDNIVSALQVAKCVYVHKNGSHVLANISVLFDFVNYCSESKIQFLNVN